MLQSIRVERLPKRDKELVGCNRFGCPVAPNKVYIRSCAYPQADVPADVAAPKLPAASPYCPLWSISSTIGYIRYIEMPFRTKATAHMMSAVFADFFSFSAA